MRFSHRVDPGPATAPALRLFRGVYEIDRSDFLALSPPPDAVCVLTVNHAGKVIGASWVVPEYAADLTDVAWNWLDERNKPPMPPPLLRLVEP